MKASANQEYNEIFHKRLFIAEIDSSAGFRIRLGHLFIRYRDRFGTITIPGESTIKGRPVFYVSAKQVPDSPLRSREQVLENTWRAFNAVGWVLMVEGWDVPVDPRYPGNPHL
jgi:hypothetical protein